MDFGCANGELIKLLQLLFGEYRYIGYDICEDMILAAKKNVPTAEFYSNWKEIDVNYNDSLLNISSTLHEVYSYSKKNEIELFWERVFNSGFKYISIRDMMLSEKDKVNIDSLQHEIINSDLKYSEKLRDYESVWGKISNQHELVHYLLKYKYTENWEREVRENYVPITIEKLISMIPDDYTITYMDHFTLPYTKWQIEKDFGFEFNTPTHVKIILQRKEKF